MAKVLMRCGWWALVGALLLNVALPSATWAHAQIEKNRRQHKELFKKIKGKIENLKKTLLNKADEYFQRLLDNLEKAREAAKDIVFGIFAFCEKEIRELIEKIKNYFMKGKTRTKTSVQQRDLPAPKKTKAALTPEQAAARAAWIKTVAKQAGMDPEDVKKLLEYCEKTDSRIIVRFTNTDGLKFQKAGDDLLKKHGVGGFLPKPLDVNTIRVDDDLFRTHATRLQVPSLDFRNDKNTRRGVKVQSLVTLQQIETADAVPMPAHPNFRTIVLEK